MAVVAKKDIQTLTKQLIQEKDNIFENIKQEFVAIEPSFLSAFFFKEVETKLNQIQKPQIHISSEEIPISLDDEEKIVERFESLDKRLLESKAIKTNTIVRKENCSMKRCGSTVDINKTLVRSQSLQSLNTTKTFNAPLAQASKIISDHIPTSNNDNFEEEIVPKLTADDLSKHNSMGKEIEMRLNSSQHTEKHHRIILSDISQIYKSSFERLNKFCEEVQKIQTSKTTESDSDMSLMSLDQNLLDLMEKLCKALYQIRFIAENQNIYTTGVKENDSLLSDDLTDILEHFYRVTK